ncbi:hypothetical protein MRB53_037447 [Persea americana]|nr:hypothetical protein MRB53_037447 [Persea americana]
MPHSETPEPPATERALRSTRNPRRRARVDSESIKVAPRRKRSKITEQTFLSRDEDIPEDVQPTVEDVPQANGNSRQVSYSSVRESRKASASIPRGDFDVPVRSGRGAKRTHRSDGATVLTQNDHYSVKLLSGTPKDLREQVDFHGSISATTNLALAVTREKAYVFDYTGYGGSGQNKVIDLPFSTSRHDPPPFGELVSNSNSSDVGLLLVSATHGKVVYHDSIERVTSLNFFQEQQKGVEGSISGLFHNEKLIQLSSAHAAGYVALLNSGRLVHITLHDSQGRPMIGCEYLYATDQAKGGLFGSIKGIFGSSTWRQAACSVRVRPLDRGQVQVLAMLEKGDLRTWELDWSGRNHFRGTLELQHQLRSEIRQMTAAESQSQAENLEVKDFVTLDNAHTNSQELVRHDSGVPIDILLLVAWGPSNLRSYFLVHVSIHDNSSTVRRVLQVRTESAQNDVPARLLLPAPGHTAHVILGDAITIISLRASDSDPEAQLHEASYIEPEPYQDTIYLKKNRDLIFLNATDTSKNGNDASSLMFVKNAGLLRLSTPNTPTEMDASFESTKSKLEQAVFYGTLENNILDLARSRETSVSTEDVEQAALSLSEAVMRSDSRFFDMPPTSIESNLTKRAGALHALASHLKTSYQPLSTNVMWRLLYDAEKLAASLQLWSTFEKHAASSRSGNKMSTLFHEVALMVNDKYSCPSIWHTKGSDDQVRTMFVKQTEHIEDILPLARTVLEHVQGDRHQSSEDVIQLVSQADDIWLDTLETAFAFRTANIGLYGIKASSIEGGVVRDPLELEDAPEPWTCTEILVNETAKMVDIARKAACATFDDELTVESEGFIKKCAVENFRLIILCSSLYTERITWYRSRNLPKYDDLAQQYQATFDATRGYQITMLAELGQFQDGVRLAEQYRDMHTLARVIVGEAQWLQDEWNAAPSDQQKLITAQMDKNEKRVSDRFDLFGNDWSEAFFGMSLSSNKAGTMLKLQGAKYNAPMTKFLRNDPARAKLSWMHDVIQNDDYQHASQALLDVATNQETNDWSKKVELSLAKLSAFAAQEEQDQTDDNENVFAKTSSELGLVHLQERFYDHVASQTLHSLDDEIAIKDAMTTFGSTIRGLPVHSDVLTRTFAKLLAHGVLGAEELIDALSIADSGHVSPQDQDTSRSETYEALQAVSLAKRLPPARRDVLNKLIWKRAYLRENWSSIEKQSRKLSEAEMRQLLSSTNLYRAVYLVQSRQLVSSDKDQIAILDPMETFGAGCHIDDLSSHLEPQQKEGMLEENLQLEQRFETLISDKRLNSWMDDIKRYVREDLLAESNIPAEDILEQPQTNGFGSHHGTNGTAHDEDEDEGIKTEDLEDGTVLTSLDDHVEEIEDADMD